MGTTYSIKIVYDPELYSESTFSHMKYSVDSILTDINRQMSTYIKDSEISLFNSSQDTTWFAVSDDFAFVLQRSIEMGNLSGGALDITVGPLVNLWGFGPVQKSRTIPPAEHIENMLNNTGLDYLRVDTSESRVKKYKKDIYCDLSSTAKGYAVDKVAKYISDLEWDEYLVEIGGEVRAHGKNLKGELWKIGIAEPNSTSAPFHVVSLNNFSMATSGDYWNYFEQDGIKYSHTIDPRTGYPVKHDLASVTIISESCLTADGLATAINVLGPDEGYRFAEENNIAAFFIIRNDDEYFTEHTPQFESMTAKERKE
jgi:thiamine biosynthesis lipoprotein